LNLQPSGRATTHAVGQGDQYQEFEADTYLVNIYLPNRVVIQTIRVSEGAIAGTELLLGMDIIAQGDFAITNYEGKTWWTFRIPSNEPIDFVEEINQYNKKYGPIHPPPRNRAERRAEQKRQRRTERNR
jgi:hypothetical protein